jgi:hypothetical protein
VVLCLADVLAFFLLSNTIWPGRGSPILSRARAFTAVTARKVFFFFVFAMLEGSLAQLSHFAASHMPVILAALSQFYRALHQRDITLMHENWEGADDVVIDNPLGGIKRRWSEISGVYESLFCNSEQVSF